VYDYGSNVVVQPKGVYVNGDPARTPEQYADQANLIANAGRSAQPDPESKWLPLGVFALVEGNAASADNIFEVAVNLQGLTRGNHHNLKVNQVELITGSMDKTSQRAAWTIGNDQTPVYEAGIANLTKNSTPILVHLVGGAVHQVSLFRLPPPPGIRAGRSRGRAALRRSSTDVLACGSVEYVTRDLNPAARPTTGCFFLFFRSPLSGSLANSNVHFGRAVSSSRRSSVSRLTTKPQHFAHKNFPRMRFEIRSRLTSHRSDAGGT
jgi:hypothetical protein